MENKINWKQKLTSRKLWLAIVGVVIGAAMAFGVEGTAIEEMVSRVAGAVTIMGSIFKYLDGESAVDAAREKSRDLAALLGAAAKESVKEMLEEPKEDMDYLEREDIEK